MPIDKTKITKEMLEKASKCNNAEELMALAKAGGFKITKTEAEAYLDELENVELDEATLNKVAGGKCNGQTNSCGSWYLNPKR
ncbi:MAG: hypothetical protein IKX02_03720 [Spirochaetales bacterium]|nr:hypothetical protein [Spirochaetales bacterium]